MPIIKVLTDSYLKKAADSCCLPWWTPTRNGIRDVWMDTIHPDDDEPTKDDDVETHDKDPSLVNKQIDTCNFT